MAASDLALVCVGTPSSGNGSLSTMYLERVADELGAAIATLGRRYTVVFRSTMLPGTCEGTLIPRLEAASGLRAGDDFGVAVNPEFLREGTSVRDFNDPPKTVVGAGDPLTADTVASLYDGLPGVVHRVPIAVAEMTKYADNSFHALKIGFANEMGAICQAYGVDSHAVMEVFASDTKLNISRAYLRPGFAFGGSCLPKDLRAIVYHARRADLSVPILENVIHSNEAHLRRVYDRLIEGTARRVALLGLAFKQGTDDLRESPHGRARRAPARARLRPQHPRRARAHLAPHGLEPRLRGRAHPAPLAAHGRDADGCGVRGRGRRAREHRARLGRGRRGRAGRAARRPRAPAGAGRSRGRLSRRGLVSGGAWRAS